TEKKSKLDSNYNDETTVELILPQALSDYVAELISNTEKNTGISFEIRIDLNDIFSQEEPDLKSIVRFIIDKIEEAPRVSTRYNNVATYYFSCSQCYKLEREYKLSNRKRIDRFDCHGRLIIHVDLPTIESMIKLNHSILHEKPNDTTMPEEIKQEI
ncbi:16045_t:CDS:2, partial [Cetraspora pellucida]